MIIALFYYLVVAFICFVIGLFGLSLLKNNEPNVFYPVVFGTAVLCFLSLMFFLFGPVNFSALISVFILVLVLFWLNPTLVFNGLEGLKVWFKQLHKTDIILLSCLFIPILYQSVQASKIHDDGMYYQQTIMWANQFGVVKGLANLHPALGLFSTWHLLTALVNPLNVGLPVFTHFNGLFLFITVLFFYYEFKKESNIFSFLGICVLPVLGFMFLTAPSADLPLILFTSIAFYQGIIKRKQTFDVLFLCIVLFSIKPPALIALALALYIVLINYRQKKAIYFVIISLLLVIPVLVKNALLSGYLLYPNAFPNLLNVDWKVPEDLNTFYRTGVISWGLSDSFSTTEINQLGNLSVAKRFVLWLTRVGYKGLLNKIIFGVFTTALLFVIGFVVKKRMVKHSHLILLGLLFILIAEWFMLSQYRLLLPTLFIVIGYLLYLTVNYNEYFISAKYLSAIVLLIIAFVPFNLLNQTSRNKNITNFKGFNSEYLIKPFSTFNLGEPKTKETDSLTQPPINYYPNVQYCWDCPLPCQSVGQEQFINNSFGYKSVYRSEKMIDGFKIIKLRNY